MLTSICEREDRLGVWLRNLERIKKRLAATGEIIPQHQDARDSEAAAVRLADQAGLEVRGRHVSALLEVVAAAGLGGLTSFVLAPWTVFPELALLTGAAVAAVGDIALKKVGVGERARRGYRR